jgi:putative DNA-invertase from lambdoid prophage Rac
MAVFGYVRVSTAEQAADDRSSLAEQERRITGAVMMLEGKIGETIPQMVRDEGVSGSVPLKKRRNGGPLMTRLQAGDYLIAAKLDRLFRSAEDALVVARELQERKVHLILTDLGSDPVTGNGISKLFFTLLAAIAEFERTRILERMNEGRGAKAKKGGHIGGDAPYGYRVEGAGKAARLVEDPEEQKIVGKIRKLRADGVPFRSVCRALAEQGILNRVGKPFEAMQIQRIVSRGRQAGVIS